MYVADFELAPACGWKTQNFRKDGLHGLRPRATPACMLACALAFARAVFQYDYFDCLGREESVVRLIVQEGDTMIPVNSKALALRIGTR